MGRMLVLAILACAAPVAISGQTLAVLHIRGSLTDATGQLRPLARHALLISDEPQTQETRRIVTSIDGTADVRLRPGRYVIESDQPIALEAVHALLHRMFVREVSGDDLELALGWTMLTPAWVRGHMINRDEDFLADYAKLTKPVLVTYGAADTVVLPAMAGTIHEHCLRSKLSEYAATGHVPFVEDPERFNRELAQFARAALPSG